MTENRDGLGENNARNVPPDRRKRVVVAMSGGVDSSIAAALLVELGYEVIGVTMQIWPEMEEEIELREGGCCSVAAVEDARRVANALGIPYYVLNFRENFQEKVIDYFIREYSRGRTPNPCIACNRHVKFETLLRKAMGLGADYIATGHYARIERDPDRGRYLLKKSLDDTKDQTYALYNLTQEQLARTLMPLGDYRKTETRRLARDLGLPVADKPDSQEICFVIDNDYKRFMAEKAPEAVEPGPILDTAGHRLGTHEGIPFYTIGQRKGLGLAAGKPLYVVDIDPERNAVVVGDAGEVWSDHLLAEDLNWISIPSLEGPLEVGAKIRYTAREAPTTVTPAGGGKVRVDFVEPQRAVTPGQAVVFYRGDEVVGGGTIVRE